MEAAPEPLALLVCGVAVLVASIVQTATGMGFGLLAGPLVLLVQPALVPGPLLVGTLASLLPVLWRERAALEFAAMRGAMLASVPGVVAGLGLVQVIDGRVLGITVGVVVLAACGAALAGIRLPGGRGALTVAGFTSGALSTVAATPGPPLVLTYRAPTPAAQRANLSLFFVGTTVLSLAVLVAGGELSGTGLGSGAVLVPFVLLGYAAAGPLRRRLALPAMRRAALVLCVVSGAALLVRSLAG
ncbi:sulfite exporter TauE/SafE family protein [Blastococcus sp. VKM Ac-2987]|uniref:sulfite exporter TauE/SafE family protein n=1 Tax=Blastococcus sp. VKM Ac-2987 TaxID=3004141 RepID=UPI0022AB8324|nr:sulfite exporter TauE/SafE family protein [Blastococcus sp. VKM Ac-2987]MCZ2860401.1 sulfite exporter TauE/SafE family protein [Blastococcus sp. VKM Ac-2987]